MKSDTTLTRMETLNVTLKQEGRVLNTVLNKKLHAN